MKSFCKTYLSIAKCTTPEERYNKYCTWKQWAIYVVNAVLLKVRPANCVSPGTTSPLSKSTRTQHTWLEMPHKDTRIAYQSSYYSGSNCHKGTQALLINLAITQALNATQGHKRSYQQAIYRSQMMGTLLPVYQNRASV